MPKHLERLAQFGSILNRGPHPFVGWMGEIGTHAEVLQPLTTHAIHYGSGAFEGVRSYRQPDGRLAIWLHQQHIDRMWHSMRVARLRPPMSSEDFAQLVLDVVALNDDGQVDSLYVRPLVHIGVDDTGYGLGVDPGKSDINLSVLTVPWGQYVATSHNGGARVLVSPRTRPDADMVDGTGKQSGFYGLFSVPEKTLAKSLGCDESVFGGRGILLDGTGQEVIIIDQNDEALILSDQTNILHSLTKWFLTDGLTFPHAQTFPYRRVAGLALSEAATWRGMALVGTASGVAHVTQLAYQEPDGTLQVSNVGDGYPHPRLVELAAFYQDVVHGKHAEYADLLTPVPEAADVICRCEISDLAFDLYDELSEHRRQAV